MPAGTNLFANIDGSTTVQAALTTQDGETSVAQQPVMLAKCQGTPPTTTNVFGPGCLMMQTDTPAVYVNTGSYVSPVWTFVFSQGAYAVLTASTVTWSGSGASLNSSIALVASTDIIVASLSLNASSYTLYQAATGTGNVSFKLSASDTNNQTVVSYSVFRKTV